jgi:hypothetical protein
MDLEKFIKNTSFKIRVYNTLKQILLDKYYDLFIMSQLSNNFIYKYDDKNQMIKFETIGLIVNYDVKEKIAIIAVYISNYNLDILNLINSFDKKINKPDNYIYIKFKYNELNDALGLVDSIYELRKEQGILLF